MGPKQLRNWMNQHSALTAAVGLLVLVATLSVVVSQMRGRSGGPPPRSGKAYYFDLTTRSLFVDLDSKVPPITSPAGHIAVRAYVFSCGSCEEESQRFVGYYQTFTPSAKASFGELPEDERRRRLDLSIYSPETIPGLLYSTDLEQWGDANPIMRGLVQCPPGVPGPMQPCEAR